MDRPRLTAAPWYLGAVVLAFTFACDGGSSPGRFPVVPAPSSPAPLGQPASLYSGPTTLISEVAGQECGGPYGTGFSQGEAWSVEVAGDRIVILQDPAGGNDLFYTGRLDGFAFATELDATLPVVVSPEVERCVVHAAVLWGRFSSDWRHFDAYQIEYVGMHGGDERRREWQIIADVRN